MKQGCVVGKFWPPHAGHHYLIEVALERCDVLDVIVIERPDERPSGTQRAVWLQHRHPSVRVHRTLDDIPDSSDAWADRTRQVLGRSPDVVFTSEDYGVTWAAELGCDHDCVDLGRRMYPVAGREVRADPLAFWHRLDAPVRGYYARRLVIVGAESTGKTTLARDLAFDRETVWVPEWARLYGEARGYGAEDWERDPQLFDQIMLNQPLFESAMAEQCNGLLVCDTDLLATLVWHEAYRPDAYAERDSIRAAHDRHRGTYESATYLLAVDDTPWVQDGARNRGSSDPHEIGSRPWFTRRVREMLSERGETVVELRGDWEERFDAAIDVACDLLEPRLPYRYKVTGSIEQPDGLFRFPTDHGIPATLRADGRWEESNSLSMYETTDTAAARDVTIATARRIAAALGVPDAVPE